MTCDEHCRRGRTNLVLDAAPVKVLKHGPVALHLGHEQLGMVLMHRLHQLAVVQGGNSALGASGRAHFLYR